MHNLMLKMYVKAQSLKNSLRNEDGQDLIEYALVVALVAFAATAGMQALAIGINGAFATIVTRLAAALAPPA